MNLLSSVSDANLLNGPLLINNDQSIITMVMDRCDLETIHKTTTQIRIAWPNTRLPKMMTMMVSLNDVSTTKIVPIIQAHARMF